MYKVGKTPVLIGCCDSCRRIKSWTVIKEKYVQLLVVIFLYDFGSVHLISLFHSGNSFVLSCSFKLPPSLFFFFYTCFNSGEFSGDTFESYRYEMKVRPLFSMSVYIKFFETLWLFNLSMDAYNP